MLKTCFSSSILLSDSMSKMMIQTCRSANTKPWNKGDPNLWKKGIYDYTYKHGRAKKVAKIQLPDFREMKKSDSGEVDPTYIATLAKERGVVPHRSWEEKPLVISCTYEIYDPYKPKPEDGKSSFIENVKESTVATLEKVRKRPVAKIKSYLPEFDENMFAQQVAPKIYEEAHKLLSQITCPDNLNNPVDESKLLQYVTEKALPEILFRTDLKVIRWKLIQHIEQPQMVHATVNDMIDAANKFGQVTVRFHTQQTLAVYDRFGRLIGGSENVVKDVLEYVIFENYLTNQYGCWRIHGKIIPDWISPTLESVSTSVRPSFKE